MGREWDDRERHGGEGSESQQHKKRKEGRAAMAGKKVKGSRVSFLSSPKTSPGHLAWLYLIAYHGLPIFCWIPVSTVALLTPAKVAVICRDSHSL
jgi:hypothetical protein